MMDNKVKQNKNGTLAYILTVIFIAALILFTVSFSIGLPIYARGFYYMQIEPLGIEKSTGFDRETIIEGYDEVLDFLTRPGGEFSAGQFAYSESGADHFRDCKVLFTLNATVYILSAIIICAWLLLVRFKVFKPKYFLGLCPAFWSGAVTLFVFAILGALVLVDFDTAFYVFHTVFFPGKSNWLFDSRMDKIILAMPEEFFMSCAALIGTSVIILSIAFVIYGIAKKIRAHKSRS